MAAANWIYRRLKSLRKKYVLDLTPDQEEAVKKFGQQCFKKGYEAAVDIASESISKTLTELAREHSGGSNG
jgi:hypothetical protein